MPKKDELSKIDHRLRRVESASSVAFMCTEPNITKTFDRLYGIARCKEQKHWNSDKCVVWKAVHQLLIEVDLESPEAGYHEFKDNVLTKARSFTAEEKEGYGEARDKLIECCANVLPEHDIDVVFWRDPGREKSPDGKKKKSSSSNNEKSGRGIWFTIKLRYGSVRCGLFLDALNSPFGRDLTLRSGAAGAIKVYRAQRGGKKNRKKGKKQDNSSSEEEEEEESESEEEEPKNKKRGAKPTQKKGKDEGNPKKKAAKNK